MFHRSSITYAAAALAMASVCATNVSAAPSANVGGLLAPSSNSSPVVQVRGGGGGHGGGGGFHGGGGGFRGGYRGYGYGYGFGIYDPYYYGAYGYPYYTNGYYGGACAGLHARAVETGSRYWWRRYRACIG